MCVYVCVASHSGTCLGPGWGPFNHSDILPPSPSQRPQWGSGLVGRYLWAARSHWRDIQPRSSSPAHFFGPSKCSCELSLDGANAGSRREPLFLRHLVLYFIISNSVAEKSAGHYGKQSPLSVLRERRIAPEQNGELECVIYSAVNRSGKELYLFSLIKYHGMFF